MLARKSLLILSTNAVGALLGLVSVFAIGRYMGPKAYGMFFFALGLVGLASFVTGLGYDQANIKRLSEGRPVGPALATYRRIKNILALLFVAGAVTAIMAWDHFKGFFDSTGVTVLLIAVAYYAFMALRRFPETTFTAFRLTANTQLMVLVENLVKAPLVVTSALLYGFLVGRWVPFQTIPRRLAPLIERVGTVTPETGAALLAGAWTIGMAASLLVGTMQMRRFGYRATKYDPVLARSYSAFALPVALSASLYIVAKQVDAVMIGYFWNATHVGYYGAAVRLTTLILVIPMAVRSLFFPLISELAHAKDHNAVRALSFTTQRTLSLVMVFATTLTVLYAAEAIHIVMADSFLPAAPVLQILALHTFAISLTTVSTSVLNGFDRPHIAMWVGGSAVLLNMALNLVFIPDSLFGVPMLGLKAPGAALASLIAQTVAFVGMGIAASRMTGRTHLGLATSKHVTAALVMAGLLHLAHEPLLGSVDRIWELGMAGLLAGVLYLGLLVLMREVTRKDLLLGLDILHPRKLAAYIRTELKEGESDKR